MGSCLSRLGGMLKLPRVFNPPSECSTPYGSALSSIADDDQDSFFSGESNQPIEDAAQVNSPVPMVRQLFYFL